MAILNKEGDSIREFTVLAELQVRMSRSYRFLLFLPHKYHVSLKLLDTYRDKINEEHLSLNYFAPRLEGMVCWYRWGLIMKHRSS